MNIFFNAFHSPLGAHASFTFGCKGKSGGLGLELSGPAEENLYIGLENSGDKHFSMLPFFEQPEDESSRYDPHMDLNIEDFPALQVFEDSAISRDFKMGTDTWKAGDLELCIYSAEFSASDPFKSSEIDQKLCYCPTVTAELTIDNRNCDKPRKAIFGYDPANNSDSLHIMHYLDRPLTGIASGQSTALITNATGTIPGQAFTVNQILGEKYPENLNFGLGPTALLQFIAPAGKKITFRIAVCFFRGGIVTSGEPASYWYSRFFKSIGDVGAFALDNFDHYKKRSLEINDEFECSHLNEAQRFQMVHAVRSYFGSTQFLD